MKSRVLQRLSHIENLGLKLLALALAGLLFAISRQPVSEVHLTGVQIEYRGRTHGVEISNDSEQTVSLRLRGPRNVVRSLLPTQLSVIADLAGKEPGDRVVQLVVDESSLPDNTRVLQIEPNTIKIRLEPTIRKSIPIEARVSGQLEDDREMYGLRYEPQTIEIEGPRSLVEKTAKVMTETVSLTGHRSTFRARVEIETLPGALRVSAPPQVMLTIDIDERRAIRWFQGLPVQWVDAPPSGRLTPRTVDVELFGPQTRIRTLSPQQIRVELKSSALGDDAETAIPEVTLPAGARDHIVVKSILPREVKVKR